MKWTTVETPEVGDLATLKDGRADSRIVTKVEPYGLIWIDLFGEECGPYPAENYDFERRVESDD